MRRYSVAQARSNFSHLLDAAEAGDVVVIERRGLRFRLVAERGGTRRAARGTTASRSMIAYIDPAVAEGQWTWEWSTGGLRFAARRRRR
jgi:antitoxin (DNA-binding transcriptional repressor) of toxin-antitoxin stability system